MKPSYVPGWGTIEGFGCVVKTLSMAAHVEHFVLDIPTALAVQAEDLVLEALPLGLFVLRIIFRIRIVRLIYQTEVDGCLWTMLSLTWLSYTGDKMDRT